MCMCVCERTHTYTLTCTHSAQWPAAPAEPLGKGEFFQRLSPQAVISVIRCRCHGLWLPRLFVPVAPIKGLRPAWPLGCFLSQPVLVKIMGLPLVTVTALISLIF